MTDTVILEVSVPATALAMDETLSKTPEVTLEIERVVAHESGTLTPYFWVRGGELETFESVIEEDPTVANATRLDIHDGGTLYRATWPAETKSIAQAFLQAGAVILEAVGQNDEWELRLRFDTHAEVTEFTYLPSSDTCMGTTPPVRRESQALQTVLILQFLRWLLWDTNRGETRQPRLG